MMIRFIPFPPLHLYRFDKLSTNHIKGTKSCQGKTNSPTSRFKKLLNSKSYLFGA